MAALVCINSKRFYSTTIKLSVKTKTYFLYGSMEDKSLLLIKFYRTTLLSTLAMEVKRQMDDDGGFMDNNKVVMEMIQIELLPSGGWRIMQNMATNKDRSD
jgi:hypothetical protein